MSLRLPRAAARVVVTALVLPAALAAQAVSAPATPTSSAATASAATAPPSTPGIGGAVHDLVPAPDMPDAAPGATDEASLEALRRATLPEPTGDAFFDAVPPGTTAAAPGEVLATRDVTATAGALAGAPIARADQFVVRSTEPDGDPTRATATLLHPAAPWTGKGPRPVLVNAIAIDSLGTRCTPGYSLAHGPGPYTSLTDNLPPTTAVALDHGYAVLVPDHQGPEMAYADPIVAGHAILDTIRGMRAVAPEYADSGVGMTGYSGGAIAALGAAKLADTYAPDLADTLAAVAIGGVPADFEMLLDSMSGNLAVGLLTAAVFGLSRHNPELLGLANNLALHMATSPLKDQCLAPLAAMGATLAPIEALARGDDALTSPEARALFARARMADVPVTRPLLVYQGAHEFWVPTAGTRALVAEQCALGATVDYREVPGEHLVAMATGFGDSLTWLDRTLRGEPAASSCA